MPVPAITKYYAYQTFLDHEGRLSIPKYHITSAAYTAYLSDTSTGLVHSLFTAASNLSVDLIVNAGVTKESSDATPSGPPASESAINTAALLVMVKDTVTGSSSRATIPARNTAAYTSVRGIVDLAGTEIAAFVAAYEAGTVSEDGNPVIVTEIKVVGR